MQMVAFILFMLAGVIAWGQNAGNVPGGFGTNSPSLQELKKMIWNNASAAGPLITNRVPGQVLSSALAGYVPDDKYKLRVGDRVSFQILEDRGTPGFLIVADSGELEFPYVGRVPAVDKTCKQVVTEVKALLEKDFYYHATVVMALDTANKAVGRVYVWGQVRTQGPVELLVNETMTAGKAILRAGGFGDFANKKKVKVVRNTDAAGGTTQSFELNMVDILENGKTAQDIALQPDDFIIVPSRLINF
jgi:polysaccharide export outer membrane protein